MQPRPCSRGGDGAGCPVGWGCCGKGCHQSAPSASPAPFAPLIKFKCIYLTTAAHTVVPLMKLWSAALCTPGAPRTRASHGVSARADTRKKILAKRRIGSIVTGEKSGKLNANGRTPDVEAIEDARENAAGREKRKREARGRYRDREQEGSASSAISYPSVVRHGSARCSDAHNGRDVHLPQEPIIRYGGRSVAIRAAAISCTHRV